MKFKFDEETTEPTKLTPNRWYAGKIVDVKELVAKTETEYWLIKWSVKTGEFTVSDAIFFTPKAKPRVRRLFGALGIKTKGEIDIEPEDLVGKSCSIYVIEEEWEGETRNKISWNGFKKAKKGKSAVQTVDETEDDEDDEDVPF